MSYGLTFSEVAQRGKASGGCWGGGGGLVGEGGVRGRGGAA